MPTIALRSPATRGIPHRAYCIEKLDASTPVELFRQLANLHVDSIHGGILEALGPNFVASLYRQLSRRNEVLMYAAVHDRKAIGFVAGSLNVMRSVKSLGVTGIARLALSGCLNAWRPSLLRKILQTAGYFFRRTQHPDIDPAEEESSVPDRSELLAIAVAKEARGHGVGKSLVRALEREIQNSGGPTKYFVTTNQEETASNAFYRASGFTLVGQKRHHDLMLNVYKKELQKPEMIPWARPHLFGEEADQMREALVSTWISGGPFVEQFEKTICDFTGARFACATTNGTTALHLTYLALGIGSGSEVVVPGFAYLGAANVALLCGALPVFAEVDPATWCLTAAAVERVLTPQTKAVVAIHTYGNMCEMDSLKALLSSRQIPLIEDAAEALGSSYKGRSAGTSGTVGTYSFHATKTITTGEGGMVVTNDEQLFERMRLYRSHGMARNVRYYWHEVPGHNFRLTNFQAAMGCAQFAHFAEIRESRATLHSQYRQRLQGEAGLTLQRFEETVTPVLWALALQLDPAVFRQGRDKVIRELTKSGLECRPGFYAASQQPIYNAPALRTCENLAENVLSLPCYIGLREDQVDYICRTLLDLRQR